MVDVEVGKLVRVEVGTRVVVGVGVGVLEEVEVNDHEVVITAEGVMVEVVSEIVDVSGGGDTCYLKFL